MRTLERTITNAYTSTVAAFFGNRSQDTVLTQLLTEIHRTFSVFRGIDLRLVHKPESRDHCQPITPLSHSNLSSAQSRTS